MNKLRTFFVTVILLTVLWGCNDPENPQPVLSNISVEFNSTQIQVSEDIGEIEINLSLSKSAIKSGTITITSHNSDANKFTTEPALVDGMLTLNLTSGSDQVSFKVFPINNNIKDEDYTAQFSLASVSEGFSIGNTKLLSVNINDDEVVTSEANFETSTSVLREDAIEDLEVGIALSAPLAIASSIAISISPTSAEYGVDYTTAPSIVNGEIVIELLPGATTAKFTIKAINNQKLNTEHNLEFVLANTTGSIVKGANSNFSLLLKDDERFNLPKGYSIGGPLGLSKTYNYDEEGRIASVQIQSGNSSRTDTYHYNSQGQIHKINSYPQINRVFTWSEGKIVRSESIEFDVVKNYTEYDYDAQGNVSGTANYFRQPDGSYTLSFVIVYLYYTDNNLYKSMYYVPGESEEEYTLLSTKTYGGYINKANPFPMVDILPTVKTMHMLPTSYQIEEHNMNLNHVLRYEYNDDGLVTWRSVWDGQVTETTSYFYY